MNNKLYFSCHTRDLPILEKCKSKKLRIKYVNMYLKVKDGSVKK